MPTRNATGGGCDGFIRYFPSQVEMGEEGQNGQDFVIRAQRFKTVAEIDILLPVHPAEDEHKSKEKVYFNS